MQDDAGMRSALTSGWVYSWFQNFVGAKRARQWLADNAWRCKGGEKFIDIGCGTGDVLEHLPATVRYVGIDISAEYVELAQRRFGNRATFLVGTAGTFLGKADSPLADADLVVCNGLLHHLEDHEVLEVLRLAEQVLLPNGRLVCFEPTFVARHPPLGRWIMNKDRGKNIRTDAAWTAIARTVFPACTTRIVNGLLRLPYTHIIIECTSTRSGSSARSAGVGTATASRDAVRGIDS